MLNGHRRQLDEFCMIHAIYAASSRLDRLVRCSRLSMRRASVFVEPRFNSMNENADQRNVKLSLRKFQHSVVRRREDEGCTDALLVWLKGVDGSSIFHAALVEQTELDAFFRELVTGQFCEGDQNMAHHSPVRLGGWEFFWSSSLLS